MKAKAVDFGRNLGNVKPLRLYLFHGVDPAGSNAIAARLAEALGGERTRLDATSLKSDPGALVDEAAGAGLFADRKLIWVEPVGNEFDAAADALLGAPSTEFPVIAIAGALTRASKLLKRVESSPDAIALVSYAPEAKDLIREVGAMLDEAGLTFEPGIAQRIAEASDLNRDIARQEVAKIALFVSPDTSVTHAAIDAIGADYGETGWMTVGDAAMDGDVAAVEAALAALSPQATEAVTLLRAMQRRIQTLAPLSARVGAGESVSSVMNTAGKSLFYRDKPIVARLLGKWPARKLARLADRVARAERSSMLEPASRRAMLGEELLAIARASEARTRR